MNNLRRISLFIILVAYSTTSVQAQPGSKYPNSYSVGHFNGLRYGFFKPANANTKKLYPLVIYLHGSRDTVSHDLMWYKPALQQEYVCFVLTPKCEETDLGWGSAWKDKHTPAATKTLALVDSLMKKYPIDPNRLYLYGISMGGFGVFSILAKEPQKFAAGCAICGGASTAVAAKLQDIPLWIFHGSEDDIVPAYLSRDIYHAIVNLGGKKVHYTEYPGVKHNSWENASREKSFNPWFFSQRRVDTH